MKTRTQINLSSLHEDYCGTVWVKTAYHVTTIGSLCDAGQFDMRIEGDMHRLTIDQRVELMRQGAEALTKQTGATLAKDWTLDAALDFVRRTKGNGVLWFKINRA